MLSLFRDSVATTNAALVLVLVVVAAAATGVRAAGIVAALSGAVWFDFFLTAPFTRFAITDRTDIETAVLLVLVGLAVTEIALWGRRQQARASREQGYLDGVLSTAATVGAGRSSTAALVEQVCRQIAEVLQLAGALADQVDAALGAPGTTEARDRSRAAYQAVHQLALLDGPGGPVRSRARSGCDEGDRPADERARREA